MSARSSLRLSLVSISACFTEGCALAGGFAVCSASLSLHFRLIRNLRPGRGDELVVRGFLETTSGEGLLAGARKRGGLVFGYEGDRAAAKASAGETRTPGTLLFRSFYEGVQLGRRDLVVVAQGGVRGVHQASELVEVRVAEGLDRLEDTGVLGDDVPGALEFCSGEEIQVPFGGVAQFFDTEHVGRA